MNLRYDLFKGQVKYSFPKDEIKYDDIVDDSHYVQDKENVRQSMLSSSSGQGSDLKYDGKDLPDDILVQIRQGKLDKAEVYQYQLKLQDEIKKTSDKVKKSQLKKQSDSISNTQVSTADKQTSDSSSANVLTQ